MCSVVVQSSVLHHSDSTIAPGQGAIHNIPNVNRISSKASGLLPSDLSTTIPYTLSRHAKESTTSTPTGRERCPPFSAPSQHVGELEAPPVHLLAAIDEAEALALIEACWLHAANRADAPKKVTPLNTARRLNASESCRNFFIITYPHFRSP